MNITVSLIIFYLIILTITAFVYGNVLIILYGCILLVLIISLFRIGKMFVYIKKIKKQILIGVTILLALVFLFYWFQWRPISIKKYCNEVAITAMKKECHSDSDSCRESREREYDNSYQRCIREEGL